MKKTLSIILTGVITAGLLAGCGAGNATVSTEPEVEVEESEAEAAETEEVSDETAEEAAPAAAENEAGDRKIVVGANPVPHADILDNAVKQVLADEGWELETVVFEDYVLPNTSLESGELDANYFQTLGYLNQQNEDAGLHLTAIAGVHIEPMGIYSEKYTSLDEIPDGAEIGIPNDPDNGERGLNLLVQKGLLTSIGDYGTDENYTADSLSKDEDANPHGYKITPLEAASLPLSLPDLDAATINGNYALGADLPSTYPALSIEEFDDEASIKRTNFIVVRDGEENSEKSQALAAAIQSDAVQKYIEDTYKGSVIPSFIDPE
ncbi:MAG: MetQ/NlpA family ABC transporter substrate-binding protein [Lachnospiraceae bacterium]|nr:MetQ/NlpA family ABC transporter substrate-binding protein [Lachnospiraceae bacterium]